MKESFSKKVLNSKKDNIDWDLVQQFKDSLEDIKHGRVRRVG